METIYDKPGYMHSKNILKHSLYEVIVEVPFHFPVLTAYPVIKTMYIDNHT